jgi:hypothetical protein
MTEPMSGAPVVMVFPTIMDGTVVRWYRTVAAAENHRPVLSASRNGVMVHAEYLTSIPDAWVDSAKTTYMRLERDRNADVRHLATHRNQGPSNGPIAEVSSGG